MKAVWNGVVVAESNDIVTVEGNAYFPAASLNSALVVESTKHTTCGWKGVASYLDLVVDSHTNKDAVWYYPTPMKGAEQVAGRVAFWKGVRVE